MISGAAHGQGVSQEIIQLREAVKLTRKNFKKDLNQTYSRLDSLSGIAVNLRDCESEVQIIESMCLYYYFTNDLDNMMSNAQELKKRGQECNLPLYEGNAHSYLSKVYSTNGFYDKAMSEIELALEILAKVDTNDQGRVGKANAHIFYSGILAAQGNQSEVINQLKFAINAYYNMDDPEKQRRGLYNNYSNIADEYASMKKADSARHYHSLAIQLRREPEDITWQMNFRTLGYIELLDGDTLSALLNFQESEAICNRTGDKQNLPLIYEEILGIAKSTNDHALAAEYLEKANLVILESSEDKNKVLRQMIGQLEDEKAIENSKRNRIIGIVGFLLALTAILSFWYYRKNQATANFKEIKGEIVSLLDMVKNDDPTFMHAFGNAFPNFTKKLIALNPELTSSEIEICALIKLKVSTKQIARLRGISHRTVQNKKYLIRKKLNIASDVNLEEWIENI